MFVSTFTNLVMQTRSLQDVLANTAAYEVELEVPLYTLTGKWHLVLVIFTVTFDAHFSFLQTLFKNELEDLTCGFIENPAHLLDEKTLMKHLNNPVDGSNSPLKLTTVK
ncbi:hypothetical protein ILYODFUR_006775 [Ilyodon furcidens]|uniref:Uncharacterized protein n=1 Tax=Ilyodon furcidens TaxID=33524 RepID=A0ABV0SUS8_9TELE